MVVGQAIFVLVYSNYPVDTKVLLVLELWELQENSLLCKARMETWPRITAMYDDLVYFYIHLEQFHPKWSKIQFDEHIFQIGASTTN